MEKKNIANLNELEFVIFCIENIALKLKVNAEEVYIALTEKSSILNDYIVLDDIIEVMEERGVKI